MTFIDLFAGLGGFHAALKSIGHECVFASEIDKKLQNLYEANFEIDCHGDIRTIDEKDIPPHDILCAGFPCQPFSKAGKQRGLEDAGRGDMIHEIVRILKFHQPKFFILENVTNIKKHDRGKTWEHIESLLKGCDYYVQNLILSPYDFGVPHKRERLFIIGTHKKYKEIEISFPKERHGVTSNIKQYLTTDEANIKKLNSNQLQCLEVWQEFINALPMDKRMPKFPIWSMEFGADYPLNDKTPFYMSQNELEQFKGSFGQSLRYHSKEEQLARLPVYSIYPEEKFPEWKIKYIEKNRNFWLQNKSNLIATLPKIEKFNNSWQKLEWNAGDGNRNILNYLLQFRSSGIRVKNIDTAPSLVLTNTQIPIIGWEKRYLNLKEAMLLQGFEKNFKMLEEERLAFKSLGNAVNITVVKNIVKKLILERPIENEYDYKNTPLSREEYATHTL